MTPARSLDNPNFMKPQEYAGDFGNLDQRIGQIGFRFTF